MVSYNISYDITDPTLNVMTLNSTLLKWGCLRDSRTLWLTAKGSRNLGKYQIPIITSVHWEATDMNTHCLCMQETKKLPQECNISSESRATQSSCSLASNVIGIHKGQTWSISMIIERAESRSVRDWTSGTKQATGVESPGRTLEVINMPSQITTSQYFHYRWSILTFDNHELDIHKFCKLNIRRQYHP